MVGWYDPGQLTTTGVADTGDGWNSTYAIARTVGQPDLYVRVGPGSAENRIGYSRCFGSARFIWWAVKDSNLGPAD
jgi:hypothetical protein